MSEQPELTPSLPPARAGTRWFWLAIIIMVAGFVIVVVERDRIRARWWAWRLARTTDLTEQGHYLGLVMGVGEAGVGAVDSLSRDERPEVRALAVVALAKLDGEQGVAGLRRLLADEDADVAESAGVSLAFLKDQQGLRPLLDAVEHGSPTAAVAAVAALPRIASPMALAALCRAASGHADARVRAQAVESLSAWLVAGGKSDGQSCDPLAVLVAALEDSGKFAGVLSLERQITGAEAMASRPSAKTAASQPAVPACCQLRSVGEIAAESLGRLTGQPIKTGTTRSPEERAKLTAQCRAWLSERPPTDSFEAATQPDQ
jgi:hypothetical protein